MIVAYDFDLPTVESEDSEEITKPTNGRILEVGNCNQKGVHPKSMGDS